MLNKIKNLFQMVLVVSLLSAILVPAMSVMAATTCAGLTGASLTACRQNENLGSPANDQQEAASCKDTSAEGIRKASELGYICPPSHDSTLQKCNDLTNKSSACGLYGYLQDLVKFLTAIVGIVVLIMIMIGGIQYSQSGGDPQKIAAAKQRIFNAIYALVAYALLLAVLQWLVPGGIY